MPVACLSALHVQGSEQGSAQGCAQASALGSSARRALCVALGMSTVFGCTAAWGQANTSSTATTATTSPPVARFATLSADQIRGLVPVPPAHHSVGEAAELLEVLALQAQRSSADVETAQIEVQRAPVAWTTWLMGGSFDAAKHPLSMKLLLDVHDNARVVVGVANNSFDIRLRPWVHAQVEPALKSELTGRERYRAGLATGLTPLDAARAAAPSSYPSARALATRLWAHTLAALWPAKSAVFFDAARASAQHRLVIGAHYRSDVEAATRIADALWTGMQTSALFQTELAAARAEITSQTPP
jgi:acid phosphatase (class A)